MRLVEAQSQNSTKDSKYPLLLSVVAPVALQWPESWLDEFPVLGAFARSDLDTMVRVLRTSDDELTYSICHTRHPTLGFLAISPMQVVNHASWSAQIIIALDAWRTFRPSLWSRQISDDGVRTHRPLLYGPLNDVRKLRGSLRTPLGDLDPRLHPEEFREVCFSVRDQWASEWPESHRISGALSFFAVGRRGARRVRHYTDVKTRRPTEYGDAIRGAPPPENKSTAPKSRSDASKLSINRLLVDYSPILECDRQETLEHAARDGESIAILRSRHRALRLDRGCLRATLTQPASDTIHRLVQFLTGTDEGPHNPRSSLLGGLSLFTGRPLPDVGKFTVIPSRTFQTGLVRADRWFFRVVLPHARPNGTASYIDHELPELMQGPLDDISIAPGGPLAAPGEVETAREEIGTYLSPYNKDLNLIYRAIIGEIRALSGTGDGGVEAVLGLNVGHATQAHYTVIELDRAKHIYRAACARLLGRASEEVFKQTSRLGDESGIPRIQASQLAISRTPVPRQAHLQDFFEAELASFRSLIASSVGRQERADASVFNGAVSFIFLLQSLLTANRPTHSVYVARHLIDQRTGLISHGDKTDEAGYERRILYFPPELLQIMKCFESSADEWCKNRQVVPCSEVPCMVRGNGTAVALSARAIESHWGSRFAFPANTPRRLHFAWLCQRGTSNLFRNMAMGHWTGGNEPWGQCSSLYLGEYLNWRRSTVTAILPELGLPDLASIVQICRSLTVRVDDDWHSSPESHGSADCGKERSSA